MAVDCSWADAQLSQDKVLSAKLPREILHIITTASGQPYLDAVAHAILIPQCTERLFALYEPLIVEVVARWIKQSSSAGLTEAIAVISALARVLPRASYLRPSVLDYLSLNPACADFAATTKLTLIDLKDEDLLQLLLAFFRLLSHERDSFCFAISPLQLQSLVKHQNISVRALAIQCIGLLMSFADAAVQAMLDFRLPTENFRSQWQDKSIDYRWLKIFEEDRSCKLFKELESMRRDRDLRSSPSQGPLSQQIWSPQTAELAGVLIPRSSAPSRGSHPLVHTDTTSQNLRMLAYALLKPRPILLIGQAGSGKISLITEAAQELNLVSSMIILHLNQQSDARSLLGVYTTSSRKGAFEWQPGMLPKAMKDGKWIVIKDIDRAPPEILHLLLPVIEKGELFVPSQGERVVASANFRLFATVTSSPDSKSGKLTKVGSLVGLRFWSQISIDTMNQEEQAAILKKKFPLAQPYLPTLLDLQRRMSSAYSSESIVRLQSPQIGLRTLLKLSSRLHRRLEMMGAVAGLEPVPENFKDDIFMDVVECYASHLSNPGLRDEFAAKLAGPLQISPQRLMFCLYGRTPQFINTKSQVKIGRSTFNKSHRHDRENQDSSPRTSPFASTKYALMTMESILAALQFGEPVLLVGETGVGKTTLVQHMAQVLGRKLTVINLSQQSEASELLGTFKPVTTRSLATPLLETFSDLFDTTFSTQKNPKFQASVVSCVNKQNWQRLLLLCREALQMAEKILATNTNEQAGMQRTTSVKRRKLDSLYHRALLERWNEFDVQLQSFKAHLARGDSSFAYAFVEGRVVQAARNGEWVLFDEINLAPPETLDSLTSLLSSSYDAQRSLFSPGSGNLEGINAHPDFRILAAMNPATDTGKKDLPQSIRARFTELFVYAPDRNVSDLVALVNVYLGPILGGDKRAVTDISQLYLEVRGLNEQNCLRNGADERPHFSVRSLVRCLLYATQHTAIYGLRRALFEGFSMAFLTQLSQESESLVLPLLYRHLFTSERSARSALNQAPAIPSEIDAIRFKHYFLIKGPLSPQPHPQYIITPFVQRNLFNLARATSMKRFPILLQGPTSSGKTSMVQYLASISGHEVIRINNHEYTDLDEYLGSYISDEKGVLRYQEGLLVRALRNGQWIVLDELNLAPTDVLEALNRLLDDNRELRLPETQEIIHPHPQFMLFATQNPSGAYGGRKPLSRAFRNRFLELHFDDIPEDELETILRERSQIAPSFCTRIVSVYKKLATLRQSSRLFEQRNSFITLRDLFRWALRPADDREQLAINGYMLLAERVRDPTERAAVKSVIEEVMKVQIDEKSLYQDIAIPTVNGQQGNAIWTTAMKRLFVLVSAAIKSNEPVLLVGDTGCGKTQICQTVAQIFNKRLRIYNAHTNTETADLIGAQRPSRHKAALGQGLLAELGRLLSAQNSDSDLSVDVLIDQFEQAEISKEESSSAEKLRHQIASYKSLFDWVDGTLVSAMKQGDFFLLDEISLAEDSVLERLNSVLEHGRTILLAEKGVSGSIVVADEGFQFLATMNPGGDYGKRELSAALRNRLTEIWVPPLSEDEDILPIVMSRLSPSSGGTARHMVEFAKWYAYTFQTSMNRSTSLRSLLSWAQFINITQQLGALVSCVHGAAMIYIDALGANPAGILFLNAQDISQARGVCIEKLSQLLQAEAAKIYSSEPILRREDSKLHIGLFSMSVDPEAIPPNEFSFEAPTTRINAMRVLRALELPNAILLEGSPGVGKTALIEALAQVAGKSLTRINLSDQTDLMDLFGADVPEPGATAGTFSWHDGPFLQAMQSGGWILLDEMNLASQSVLEGLNSCLDHRQEVYISELDQTFSRHPDFVLFAAQNPHHQGGGRKGLPASFVNRFTVVYLDAFTGEDLALICTKRFPSLKSSDLANMLTCVSALQQSTTRDPAFTSDGGPWEINLRDINRWAELLLRSVHHNLSPAQYFDVIFGGRFRTAEQKSIARNIMKLLPQQSSIGTLYHNLTPELYHIGKALLGRHPSFQHIHKVVALDVSILPQVETIMHCVYQNWPTILVGRSGSGKTNVIRHLAAVTGNQILELAMSTEMDTMDLLGGFDQANSQRVLVGLQQGILGIARDHVTKELGSKPIGEINNSVLELLRQCSMRQLDLLTLRSLIAASVAAVAELETYIFQLDKLLNDGSMNPRFEWVDGPLIDAVEKGYWAVLDNANFCNSSVLDRLNSLMEPGGSLVLSEQHNQFGQLRIVKPHHNFRLFLTMDPRYGELSRAMRNRSIEVFLPGGVVTTPPSHAPAYPDVSAISRFRPLLQVEWAKMDPKLRTEFTRFALSHLTLHEFSASSTWNIDLSGLIAREEFKNYVRIYQALPVALLQSVEAFYHSLSLDLRGPKIPIENLPLNPLLVQNLLHSTQNQKWQTQADDLASLLEMSLTMSEIRGTLASLSQEAEDPKVSGMTVLVRGLKASKEFTSTTQKGSLSALVETIAQHLGAGLFLALKNFGWVHFSGSALESLLNYLRDLIEFANSQSLPFGALQAYIRIGRKIVASITHGAPYLAQHVDAGLNLFEQDKMRYGLGLRRMWNDWRPKSAQTSEVIENLAGLERIFDCFDVIYCGTSIPLKQKVQLRLKLLETWKDTLYSTSGRSALIDDLRTATAVVEKNAKLSVHPISGYFCEEFEVLAQISDLFLDNASLPTTDFRRRKEELEILAFRPLRPPDISTESLVPSILDKIASFGGWKNAGHTSSAWRGTFGLQVLSKVDNIENQPLGVMDSLKEEVTSLISAISTLATQISSNYALVVASEIRAIIYRILHAHIDLLAAKNTSEAVILLHQKEADLFKSEVPKDHYFRYVLSTYLIPAALSASRAESLEAGEVNQWRHVGSAVLCVSIASLVLLVPDQPLDPALELEIDCQRHEKRLSEKRTKLEALEIFEMVFSGTKETNFTQKISDEIAELSQKPASSPVYRPQVSQLSQLQGEFTNLLQIIIAQLPKKLLQADDDGSFVDESPGQSNVSIFRENILQIVQRLSQPEYRAYSDLVIPCIRTLQCLKLGVDLITFPSEVKGNPNDSGHQLDRAKLLCWKTRIGSHEMTVTYHLSGLANSKKGLQLLDRLTFEYNVARSSSPKPEKLSGLLLVFDSIYRDWKIRLKQDQASENKRSKYYTYQGVAGDDGEVDQGEVGELFPTFDGDTTESAPTEEPKRLATLLAQAMTKITSDEPSVDSGAYISETLDFLMASLHVSSWPFKCAKSSKMLPATLLALDQQLQWLQGHGASQSLNIYTDGSILETKKLCGLVQKIHHRFEDIHKSWPEHALPLEICAYCKTALQFSVSEPVAKLLSLGEKMYGLVNEWQGVASREYSADPLAKELVELIIHWRRLELASWGRLLESEAQKANGEAQSWFFVIYESIIAIPFERSNAEEDFTSYVEDLIATLEGFLRASSLGQYYTRFELLNNLSRFASNLDEANKFFRPFSDPIQNLLQHYSKYIPSIQAILSSEKSKLEREVQEQIKLASWKDTNIIALRESARRSHHKLFKIVRNYRALLGKPVDFFDVKYSDNGLRRTSPSQTPAIVRRKSSVVDDALSICERYIASWSVKPTRFQDPFQSAQNMQRVYAKNFTDFDAAVELAELTDGWTKEIRGLRSQTPANMNETNRDLVHHLKARKRRLLADIIRSLRHMGIRRNLGSRELSQQSSTAQVLSRTPYVGGDEGALEPSPASSEFHGFLHLMPNVRAALQDHSDDLRASEVTKCTGLAEGLMSHVLAQRGVLGPLIAKVNRLERLVGKLANLQRQIFESIIPLNRSPQLSEDQFLGSLAWLPGVLDISVRVLKIQQEHSSFDLSHSIQYLAIAGEKLRSHRENLRIKIDLPAGLSTQNRLEQELTAAKCIMELRDGLHDHIDNHPETAFLLGEVLTLTDIDLDPDVQARNGFHTIRLRQFDEILTESVNKIFVALQNSSKSEGIKVSSTEDANWLSQYDKGFMRHLSSMHIDEINSSLELAIAQLQHVEENELPAAVALAIVVTPVVEQFYSIHSHACDKYSTLHYETSRMANMLARSFTDLAREGFCSPADTSATTQGQSSRGEDGTGLGEGDGEGAEDISGEIGDDEDLSELAQQQSKGGDREEMTAEKDARDMEGNDLEGDFDDAGEPRGDENRETHSGSDDDDSPDEEIGSIDDLDPTAVDEKLWDEAGKESAKEKTTNKGPGHTSKTKSPGNDDNKVDVSEGSGEVDLEPGEEEGCSAENGNETVDRDHDNELDEHVEQQQVLDIPEEMQLDGKKDGSNRSISDEAFDELSDVEVPGMEEAELPSDSNSEDYQGQEKPSDAEAGSDVNTEEYGGTPSDTDGHEVMDEYDDSNMIEELGENRLAEKDGNGIDSKDVVWGEMGTGGPADEEQQNGGQDQDEGDAGATSEAKAQSSKIQPEHHKTGEAADNARALGQGERGERLSDQQMEAVKRLGDVLDQWHRRREISKATDNLDSNKSPRDVDMRDADFEHVQNETDDGDTQALDAATKDEARALDYSKGLLDRETQADNDHDMPNADDGGEMDHVDNTPAEQSKKQVPDREASMHQEASASIKPHSSPTIAQPPSESGNSEEYKEDHDHLGIPQLPTSAPEHLSPSAAAALWTQASSSTHALSQILTEQLRLILSPTLATKLRGDFRTGKRLNLKRIIPYIASGYRRDKIWMRRSIPSKREYQVMIAVDNSKSMLEGGAGQLALESLALLCKSLSMLEAGELCVVGFGDEEHVRVAHPFDQPFTNDAGPSIFQHFAFQQTRTDVQRLVVESMTLFGDARAKARHSAADLWQLELIISDGIFEEHERIRRLVLQAREERIMIVFVVVDGAPAGSSILALTQATFDQDASGEADGGAAGEMKLKMKRYLDGFPFPYYLIVRDVRDLPGVLATALKGWFAEVAGSQG